MVSHPVRPFCKIISKSPSPNYYLNFFSWQHRRNITTICSYTLKALYEWDEDKSEANLSKHGLSFEDSETVFSGECITFEDDRFDYGEQRFITLGKLEGRIVIIAHTPRGENTRIISMRKANAREQKIYKKRLEKNWCYEGRGYRLFRYPGTGQEFF